MAELEKVPCTECGKPVTAILARERSGLCFSCLVKHIEKVPCAECGKPVWAKLAQKDGLCMQCRAKRNPFFVLYASMIDRVCNADGFQSLSEPEQTYYALTLFQNEVNNGGFHQFFFNSSGSYYDVIENGLVTFNEPQTLELLHRAKQIVFPDKAVPADTEERRNPMLPPEPEVMNKLNELDQRFYRIPDTLRAKLETFACEKNLVPAGENDQPTDS
jgi:endogenous inhibitor of DNA gyrase (YacG/DUF329 family)